MWLLNIWGHVMAIYLVYTLGHFVGYTKAESDPYIRGRERPND